MVDLIDKCLKLLEEAIFALYHDEADVVAINANERCMAAHVFAYMKREMANDDSLVQYKIDYEYNREGPNGVPKKLLVKYVEDKKMKKHLIIPDMIIHRRLKNSCGDNLVIVEFKKPDIPCKDDIVKLREMTKQENEGKFKYKVGILVVFGTLLSETKFRVYVDGFCRNGSFTFNHFDSQLVKILRLLKELFPNSSISFAN